MSRIESLLTAGPDRLARRLAVLRPLDPYPGWCFGDPEPDDMPSRTRFLYWRLWRRLGVEHTISAPWYGGTELELRLANDTSRCLFVSGCFEPNELAFVSRVLRPGMTVVDAGANEGLVTVLAAVLVGPDGVVLAVEPSPRELERLEANVARNELQQVRIRSEALVDVPGTVQLKIADAEHAGHNTLGAFVWESVHGVGTCAVPGVTLDGLLASERITNVDFLKLDVEGAEMKILEGASDLLGTARPVLLMELQEASLRQLGSSVDEVVAHLSKFEYEVCAFSPRTGVPERPTSAPIGGLNVAVLPHERADAVLAIAARPGPVL
jgi:FkbM family methyltransferase